MRSSGRRTASAGGAGHGNGRGHGAGHGEGNGHGTGHGAGGGRWQRGAAGPARFAVSAHFLVMGLTAGVWMARIPAAKSQAHLSDGTLGIALFAVPLGLVIGAALAERLVDRAGSALLVRICGVGNCVAAVTPGLARSLPELMAALFAIGVTGGILDVATNAQGVRVEAAYGRPVMTSMHAFYSLGAILGSLIGAAFAWAGVALLPALAAVDIVGVLIDGTAGLWFLPEPSRAAQVSSSPNEPDGPQGQLYWPDGPEGEAVLSPGVPGANCDGVTPGTQVTENSPAARRHVRRLVLVLGVLGVCGLVGEGAAGDWSAVYLRDNLGTSAGFAALGFAAFSVTMTLGRGVGDQLIRRFGVVPVIRVCGLVATAGIGLAIATPVPALAIAGFTTFGAGLSIVVPQVFAAGGRADPFRPGSGLAKVVGFGYTGMAAGPAIIGLVASKIGLHLALLIPVVLAAGIAVAAPALGDRGATGRDPVEHASVRDNARTRSHGRAPRAYLKHMDDKEIMSRITGLIDTEHELRGQLQRGELSSEQERERLRSTEEALDQCWDLLRQRRAKREYGESPEDAAARPVPEVEGYQQ